MCDWVILKNDDDLADSESPEEQIEQAISYIDGQCLAALPTVDDKLKTWGFKFDLGGALLTRPYDDGDQHDQWMLFEADGNVVSSDQTGRLTREPGSRSGYVRRSRHH